MIVDRREMRQRLAGLLAKLGNIKSPLVVDVEQDKPQPLEEPEVAPSSQEQ
jgi:acetyl-CoA carboxylase carboxyltransferase subunit alpha